MAEELIEPLWLIALLLRVPEGFGCYISLHSARSAREPLMVRTILKVYMELGSYFLFLQEQIKDIIIIG